MRHERKRKRIQNEFGILEDDREDSLQESAAIKNKKGEEVKQRKQRCCSFEYNVNQIYREIFHLEFQADGYFDQKKNNPDAHSQI